MWRIDDDVVAIGVVWIDPFPGFTLYGYYTPTTMAAWDTWGNRVAPPSYGSEFKVDTPTLRDLCAQRGGEVDNEIER
jgi:hypothetical protein